MMCPIVSFESHWSYMCMFFPVILQILFLKVTRSWLICSTAQHMHKSEKSKTSLLQFFLSLRYISIGMDVESNCCVWGVLSLFWKFVVPLYCGDSLLWVGLDSWLVKVSWLGKLVSVFWWVELDLFSLECSEVSSSEFWDISGFGVTLGRLYIEAQGYVSVLLEYLLGMSCSGTCWFLGCAWFQCRYGGFWWALID